MAAVSRKIITLFFFALSVPACAKTDRNNDYVRVTLNDPDLNPVTYLDISGHGKRDMIVSINDKASPSYDTQEGIHSGTVTHYASPIANASAMATIVTLPSGGFAGLDHVSDGQCLICPGSFPCRM
ncbi:MAG: hypothetical protein JO142_17815 [Burkholderiales bacterium]|nr:hypothetical protein [Burkholderiales bacterium]